MGQIKGNPIPSPQNQAYEALRPNLGTRDHRDLGSTPMMIDADTTANDTIDVVFAKDTDLTDGTKNAIFNTVAATSNGAGQNFKVGDDAWIGDMNKSNTIVISGVQEPTAATIQFGSGSQPSISHLVVGAAFPAVGSSQAITGSLLMGHSGHLYFFNGGAANGGWAQVI